MNATLTIAKLVIWLTLCLTLGWLVAGCASTRLPTPASNTRLGEAQAMANRVTAHYQKPPVTVKTTDAARHAFYWLGLVERIIYLPNSHLAPGYAMLEETMAHELAHHLLGHGQGTNAFERHANVKSVEILAYMMGLSEQEAFERIARFLSRTGRTRFHPGGCAEVAPVLKAYPQYRHLAGLCARLHS